MSNVNISDKAMLAHLEMRFSKFEKTDRRISTEMATLKGAKDGIFKAHRTLFPGCDAPHKAVLAAMENVRSVHEYYTTPWPPSRALKIEDYPKHREVVNQAIGQFTVCFSNFEQQYDTLVKTGIKNSNGLNKPEEYMPKDELAERFQIILNYSQLTAPEGWTNSIMDPTIQAQLIQQTKEAQARLLQGAVDHVKDQFCAILRAAKDNLTKTQDKQEGQRFHTAWLPNLQQFCEIWPGLNLTDDPLVAEMILALDPILKHSPETMKSSKEAQTTSFQILMQFISTYDSWLNA